MTAHTPTATNNTLEIYAALLQEKLSGDAALLASQEMLQLLMDSLADAVWWKDTRSRYLGCNRVFASFAGVEPVELLGMTDREMPWADNEEYSADWFIGWDQVVMESGQSKFGIVEQVRSATGEPRWVATNKVPLRDPSGEVIGVLGTFQDVTERRNAEEALHRTLDELDERVRQRTADLLRANESLRREVDERVRLQAEERQQRAYAEALRDLAATTTATLDLGAVLERVVSVVERLVTNDFTAVILNNDGELEMACQATGYGYQAPEPARPDLARLTIIEALIDRPGGPVVVEEPDRAVGRAGCVLGAPMSIGDHVVGYVMVESATRGFFAAGHSERLGAVADQAAAAISNVRLFHKASELAAQEERQRLARELHDAVNQALWTASLTADDILRSLGKGEAVGDQVERLRRLTRGALAEMRTLLLELRPTELSESAIDDLILQLVTALSSRKSLEVSVDLEPVDLDPEQKLAFYRIAQEALNNVARHSEASRVEVCLTSGRQVELVVRDNGVGIDPATVPSGHLGLSIMAERAAAVGAHLEIGRAGTRGTVVRLTVASGGEGDG